MIYQFVLKVLKGVVTNLITSIVMRADWMRAVRRLLQIIIQNVMDTWRNLRNLRRTLLQTEEDTTGLLEAEPEEHMV